MRTDSMIRLAAAVLAALGAAALPRAAAAADARSVEEVRNTVINLLETLVQKGVMTREQAERMVADARGKAEREAEARVAGDADAGEAVRVTYVPQVVRDEISRQVREDVRPEVVQEVIRQARDEQWGVPGALPDWIKAVRMSGDVRVRGQWDLFASDNAQGVYLDFLTVNDKGGIVRAGDEAFFNVSEDQFRTRVRARLGLQAQLGEGFSAGLRMTTGNFSDPVSTNETMEQSSGRYTFGLDRAYLRYDLGDESDWSWLSAWTGRAENPFESTDLLFDRDLSFEGAAVSYRYGINRDPARRNLFATLGAFPLEQTDLFSSEDKWLYAGQVGGAWSFDNRMQLRGAVGYYHYDSVTGIRNAFESTARDWTAPLSLQKGNTMFDIRNDADPTTNLFALAAEYHILNAVASLEVPVGDGYQLTLLADYARNLGYDRRDILARTGLDVAARDTGYQLELGFGHAALDRANAWRAAVRYRYLERDAVLDAFTDSDFHLGGTDAEGYTLRADYGLARRVYLSLRYLSANEIDNPPLGIDVVMLDVNGSF